MDSYLILFHLLPTPCNFQRDRHQVTIKVIMSFAKRVVPLPSPVLTHTERKNTQPFTGRQKAFPTQLLLVQLPFSSVRMQKQCGGIFLLTCFFPAVKEPTYQPGVEASRDFQMNFIIIIHAGGVLVPAASMNSESSILLWR